MEQLYEISFVGGDALHQFRTRMTHEMSTQLRQAIFQDTDRMMVSDVQVYPVSEDPNESSAIEMVEILEDNTEDYEELLPALRELAEKVDSAADADGATKEVFLIEYVWANGGGDDNAFSQNVCVNKTAVVDNQEFFEALERYLEDRSYDYVVSPFSDVQQREISFRDAVDGTREVLIDLGQPLTKFDTIWQSIELNDNTVPVSKKRNGPRL